MRFVWDESKSRRNLAKHRVSFELAALVFEDPWQVSIPDPYEGENRWRTLGLVQGVVILLVVHTVEEHNAEEEIRIISARKATRAERQAYNDAR
ncbi:MAG: BrnT family toxin [Terriglobales bacterium]